MSRPRIRYSREGFFEKFPGDLDPTYDNRNQDYRKDDSYTDDERDTLYNLLFARGITKYVYHEWEKASKRSVKSAVRQFQLILFALEQNSIVYIYLPGPFRKSRVGKRFGAADKKILRKHLIDGVPYERTAVILMRTVKEIEDFHRPKERRNAGRPPMDTF